MRKFIVPALLILAGCTGKDGAADATGTFQATELIVSAEVPGRIIRLDAEEGARLTEGETIGLIDTVQLYLQKRQLMDNILAVRASRPSVATQIAPLEEQLTTLRRDRQRIVNLIDADAANRKQLDDINSAVAGLEKQIAAQRSTLTNALESADAQIAAMRTQIEQLDDQMLRSRITAPITGTVVAKYAHAGELATQGRPLLKIADMDNIHLKAYVTSAQLADIELGRRAHVTADFGGGNTREYDGVITWISDKSEFTPKNIVTSDDRANMVYALKISVKNDGYLKIGMYGEVRFLYKEER